MKVVNQRDAIAEVRIDRSEKWGNPYRIGLDGDRAEVVTKYEAWIRAQPELLAALPEIAGKTLGCWCDVPRVPCHGQVLIRLCRERGLIP